MFNQIKRHRDPELRYSTKSKCFRSYDPDTKKASDMTNEPMIVDMATVRHGWELLASGKKRDLKLVYVNEPLPPEPSPAHQTVGMVRVVSPSIGRATVIVDTNSIADAFTALHEQYVEAPAAAKGLLPIVSFTTDDPAFEIIDWEERNEQFFGERILPLPTA